MHVITCSFYIGTKFVNIGKMDPEAWLNAATMAMESLGTNRQVALKLAEDVLEARQLLAQASADKA